VQVSPLSPRTTPFFATEHEVGVNEDAVTVVMRDVGTLIDERYGEVWMALNFDISFFMLAASLE
jgi:hypothetical protein